MNKGILFLSVILSITGFTQDNSYKPKYSTILDSGKGERLSKQCSRDTPTKISGYWTPTEDDVKVIEDNFMKIRKLKSRLGKTISTLDKFAFQYVGVKINGKKLIYINAFHLDSDEEFTTLYKNWKTDPVVMCDGGDFYWGALFDVSKLRFRELAINGV